MMVCAWRGEFRRQPLKQSILMSLVGSGEATIENDNG
jgi:hypothetical protein